MQFENHTPGSGFRLQTSMLALCAVLLPLWLALSAGAAAAANYSLTGFMLDIHGPISIPMGETLLQKGRGVPGSGTVSQMGAPVPGGGPATIYFPGPVFSDDRQFGGFVIPVPSVIQLTTSVQHVGPTVPTTLMALRTVGPPSFAYCPGAAANPSCTTVTAGGSQGDLNGIVRYTAGPNRFGGTFKMLLNGTSSVARRGGPLPPTVMTAMGATREALPFSVTNYNVGGTAYAAAGRDWLFKVQDPIEAQPRTHPYGYMETPKGLLSRGPYVGPGFTGTNTGTGFPFTTGHVYVYAKLLTQVGGAGVPIKHSVSGYDRRTSMGAGRIHMVAASMTRAYPTDGSDPPEGGTPNYIAMWLTMVPQPALSLSSPALQGTLAALLLLSAGFAVSMTARRGTR